eukprot:CAMPEP_0195527034 /NCGR_PEP_ID=MMETSP0794_2-20130614/28452_1 /TAXON_ID=515487 /ORGANISM="Stephanopyxis turris, Strain CCMP 815" /LENGTH=144 /DNA_ID=CAMNT_0040657857 /DNA_START=158 /DNA_END=595 /DNA_ORIENTATION=-
MEDERDETTKTTRSVTSQATIEVTVPYVLQEASDGRTRAIFTVPAHLASILTSSSVYCRGSKFELQVGGDDDDGESTCNNSLQNAQHNAENTQPPISSRGTTCSIFTEFHSPKANLTADAIARRLGARISDPQPPGAEDVCLVS